ncbi:MAG: HAMP domain-containing protein, partial [Bdellovibrionales bacterium]|nr:HAMP domain-containing protein [Bdellovibrionales bacterium]
MEKPKKSLSLKNKLLIVLSTLPIISIALIVAMATSLFENDKLAYVYDTALSSTRATSSTLKTQLNSYIQELKALSVNFSPDKNELTTNGLKYFEGGEQIKGFFNYRWIGKSFQSVYNKIKVDKENVVDDEVMPLLQEAWYKGFSVGVSKKMPMHFYLAAKVGDSKKSNDISLVLIENANFFSLFGEQSNGHTFLFHPSRGLIIGDNQFSELPNFLTSHVYSQKFHEGTKDAKLKAVDHLVSYSKAGMGDLYIVSALNKEEALSAVKTLLKRSVAFSFVILCVLIIMGVFASNTLTVAIRSLAEATSKVMDGDFSVRVEPKSGDEIGALAQSFNKMTEEVSRLMVKTAEKARMEAELKTAHTVQETLFPRNDDHIGPLS